MIKRLGAVLFCVTLFAGAALAADDGEPKPVIDEGCTAAKPVKGANGACFACNSLKVRNSYQHHLEQCPQYRNKYKATKQNYVADIPDAAKAMQNQDQTGTSASSSGSEAQKSSSAPSSASAGGKKNGKNIQIGSRSNAKEKKSNDCPLDAPAMDMSGTCHKCSDMVVRRNPGRYANVCVGGKPVDFSKSPTAGKRR